MNCVFRHGSTGKIVDDIHKVLRKEGVESVVCYGRGRGRLIREDGVYKFCREWEGDLHHAFALTGIGLAYGGNYFPTRRLIKIIEREKPDVVHLHCINGYCVNVFSLLRWLGRNRIKTVVTNHAEFFYTGNCGHAYDCEKWERVPGCGNCPMLKFATGSLWLDRTAKSWKKMRDAFSCHKEENLIFTAVSPWVKSRFELSPVTSRFSCEVVENGVETDIFKPRIVNESIRGRIGNMNKRVVFHVTAAFSSNSGHIKGGYYVLEVAKRLPEVQFVVAALHGEVKDLPSNVFFWGATRDQQELSFLYSLADLTLLTSKRETYSMVTVESLCCGTPVAGFQAGGPESIALSEYSCFVEYGNIDALVEAVREMLKRERDKAGISKIAHARYSKEKMTERYLEVYNRLIDKN